MSKEINQELNNKGEIIISNEVKNLKTHTEKEGHQATLYAESVFQIGSLQVSNALLISWVTVLIIIILSLSLRLSLKKIPGKLQHFFELVYEGALSLCDQVTNNRKKSEKLFPISISLFFFILVNNWLGLIPFGGLGTIQNTGHGEGFIPFLRSGTADINTTIALAVITVVGANIFGIISIGLWKMFNKYVNLKAIGKMVLEIKKNPMGLIIAPISFFVGLLEIIGEFAKIASLSFRLFGNIFAGEVLLASMAALFAYILPTPFLFLEIMIGVIQALVFSMLTLVYFTIASEDHEEHNEKESLAHA